MMITSRKHSTDIALIAMLVSVFVITDLISSNPHNHPNGVEAARIHHQLSHNNKMKTSANNKMKIETSITTRSNNDTSEFLRIPYDWYLTNLKAVVGENSHCPAGAVKQLNNLTSDGMVRVSENLKVDTGVTPIFLCKDRVPPNSREAAVTTIMAHATTLADWSCPSGWKSVGTSANDDSAAASLNLNKGTGGLYVRLCYQTATFRVVSIVANIKIMIGNSASDNPPCVAPYVDLAGSTRVNFNAGSGGKSVYMCMRLSPDLRTI